MKPTAHSISFGCGIMSMVALCCSTLAESFFREDFNGGIGPRWTVVRQDTNYYTTTETALVLRASSGDLFEANNTCGNLFLIHNPIPGDFVVTLKVNSFIPPARDHPQIVIVAYDDDDNHVRSGYGMIDATPRLYLAAEVQGNFTHDWTDQDFGSSSFYLQLRKAGATYAQYYSTDGVCFVQVGAPVTYGDGTPAKLGFVAMVDPTETSQAVIDSFAVAAAVIDFEEIPGLGSPVDGMVISNQFLADFGVSFSFEGGGYPVLAMVGAPTTAFTSTIPGIADQPAGCQNVGTFFLTDDGTTSPGLPHSPFIISYATPVQAATGVIIDVDGGSATHEAWRIEARNASGGVLDTLMITTNSPNAGDGLATPWFLSRPSADISSIRIVYVGTKTSRIGFALDNFSASSPLSLRIQVSEVEVCWDSVPSATYRVEYRSDLTTNVWTAWTNCVPSGGSETCIYDKVLRGEPQRFYRVVVTNCVPAF